MTNLDTCLYCCIVSELPIQCLKSFVLTLQYIPEPLHFLANTRALTDDLATLDPASVCHENITEGLLGAHHA